MRLVCQLGYLHWAVVLVALYLQFAAGGEVVRLGEVATQPVVFHGVFVVGQAELLFLPHVGIVARPQLSKVWYNVVSSKHTWSITK